MVRFLCDVCSYHDHTKCYGCRHPNANKSHANRRKELCGLLTLEELARAQHLKCIITPKMVTTSIPRHPRSNCNKPWVINVPNRKGRRLLDVES